MALKKMSLFSGPTTLAQTPRMHAEKLLVARFSTGSELLPVGSPVAFQLSTQKWVPYTQPSDPAIYTLTNAGGDLDGGSFQLSVNGLVATFAWNATAAAIQAELLALLLDAGSPITVAAVATMGANIGANGAIVTLTFSENAGAPSLDFDGAGLTDGGVSEPAGIVLAASDAGTQLDDTNLIRGFVYESPVQLDSMDDVQGVVLVRGEVYAADVNTSTIRAALRGSPSEAEVQAALKDQDLGDRIMVRGLAGAI